MDDRSLRSLPLYRDVPELPKTPKVDEVRKRLGGRQGTGPRVGRVVRVTMGSGLVPGVILAESDERCDVWVGAGTMRREESEGMAEIRSRGKKRVKSGPCFRPINFRPMF